MSRKGAKSRMRVRKLRSTGKAGKRVTNGPNSLVELKKQLETRTRELAEARTPCRGAGAADGDLGGAASDQPLPGRFGARVPFDAGERNAHLRRSVREFVSLRGRRISHRCDARRGTRVCRGSQKQSTCSTAPGIGPGRVAITKQPAHITDIKTTRSYIEQDRFLVRGVTLGGYRTIVAVPMLKNNELIGAILIFPRRSNHSATSISSS